MVCLSGWSDIRTHPCERQARDTTRSQAEDQQQGSSIGKTRLGIQEYFVKRKEKNYQDDVREREICPADELEGAVSRSGRRNSALLCLITTTPIICRCQSDLGIESGEKNWAAQFPPSGSSRALSSLRMWARLMIARESGSFKSPQPQSGGKGSIDFGIAEITCSSQIKLEVAFPRLTPSLVK